MKTAHFNLNLNLSPFNTLAPSKSQQKNKDQLTNYNQISFPIFNTQQNTPDANSNKSKQLFKVNQRNNQYENEKSFQLTPPPHLVEDWNISPLMQNSNLAMISNEKFKNPSNQSFNQSPMKTNQNTVKHSQLLQENYNEVNNSSINLVKHKEKLKEIEDLLNRIQLTTQKLDKKTDVKQCQQAQQPTFNQKTQPYFGNYTNFTINTNQSFINNNSFISPQASNNYVNIFKQQTPQSNKLNNYNDYIKPSAKQDYAKTPKEENREKTREKMNLKERNTDGKEIKDFKDYREYKIYLDQINKTIEKDKIYIENKQGEWNENYTKNKELYKDCQKKMEKDKEQKEFKDKQKEKEQRERHELQKIQQEKENEKIKDKQINHHSHKISSKVEIISQISNLTLKIEQSLDQYQIGKVLGLGSYASVKLASYQNQKVAIKTYEKLKLSDAQKIKNVQREIKILSKLNHPNIIKLYSCCETENQLNLVMEFMSEVSLSQFLKSNIMRKINERDAKKIFSQICSALKYCHSKNVVHRDIKLENILVDQYLTIKIIDFGFSIAIDPSCKLSIFCGTPSYMAPEIVNRQPYSFAADVWAIGVLIYKMVTGNFPFRGADDRELYAKINQGKPDYEGLSTQLRSLLEGIFTVEESERLSIRQITKHEWLSEEDY